MGNAWRIDVIGLAMSIHVTRSPWVCTYGSNITDWNVSEALPPLCGFTVQRPWEYHDVLESENCRKLLGSQGSA